MKKNKLILFLIIILNSCSTPMVLHLKKNRLLTNQSQILTMKYIEFHYTCYQKGSNFYVKGFAYPRREKLPPWGDTLDELWLGIYLCDKYGKVLAQDINVYSPQKINNKGLFFEFKLEPKNFGAPGPLYITFGYRLKIIGSLKNQPKVFFAIEKAIE
ncbi:hypothetical protein [Desulfothermus sp.]